MMNMFGSSAPAMFSSAAINPPHELNCHLCGIRLGQFSGGRYGYNRNVCVSDSTHCKRLREVRQRDAAELVEGRRNGRSCSSY
jgi:hypothetical protein